MDKITLAYLAGAIDADGCFSIKRSTIRMRNAKDCRNPCYDPRVMLGQVTSAVPELLKQSFGGSIRIERRKGNSKPIYKWMTTSARAARRLAFCCRS